MASSTTEYREIIQHGDMSDSDMIEHIRRMVQDGYSLEEYRRVGWARHYVFVKYSQPVLTVFGTRAEA